MTNLASKEERIRRQAYQIWLDEGKPEGRHKEHWAQAARIVEVWDELAKGDETGAAGVTGAPFGPGQA